MYFFHGEMSVAEMFIGRNVRGRNVHGRNVLAETSVAEMSVAEMSEHPTGYLWSKYECFLIGGCKDIDF